MLGAPACVLACVRERARARACARAVVCACVRNVKPALPKCEACSSHEHESQQPSIEQASGESGLLKEGSTSFLLSTAIAAGEGWPQAARLVCDPAADALCVEDVAARQRVERLLVVHVAEADGARLLLQALRLHLDQAAAQRLQHLYDKRQARHQITQLPGCQAAELRRRQRTRQSTPHLYLSHAIAAQPHAAAIKAPNVESARSHRAQPRVSREHAAASSRRRRTCLCEASTCSPLTRLALAIDVWTAPRRAARMQWMRKQKQAEMAQSSSVAVSSTCPSSKHRVASANRNPKTRSQADYIRGRPEPSSVAILAA
eukprot:3819366-Pleurochrysis_carterae.AAC.2